MSKQSNLACIVPLLLLALVRIPSAEAAWNQPMFALGTYWDPRQECAGGCGADSAADLISFQRAKGAYFNLLTGTGDNANDYAANCTPGSPCYPNCIVSPVRVDQSALKQKYALRVAARADISYLIRDYAIWKNANFAFNPGALRTMIQDYFNIMDIGALSHLYGFNYWDEVPITNPPPIYVRRTLHVFNEFPARPAYASFFPHYECFPGETNCAGVQAFPTRMDYENYINGYMAAETSLESPPTIVAFDHYPFTALGVRKEYFYNLSLLRNQAGNRPLWAHVLTTPHGRTSAGAVYYPDPSAGQLGFMTYCPIAYGAKGLLYFTYEMPTDTPCATNYWSGQALVDPSGQPVQPKFDRVKAINRYITYTLGPMVMARTFVKTYHASTAPTTEPIPPGESLANSGLIVATNRPNLLFGVFEGDAGGKYLIIVNKDWNAAANGVTVDFTNYRILEKGPASSHPTGGQGVGYFQVAGTYHAGANYTRYPLGSIDAGGALIVRVSAPTTPPTGGGCGGEPCQTEPSRPMNTLDSFGRLVLDPTPSNGTVTFRLSGSKDQLISVRIYDLAGRQMADLDAGEAGAAGGLVWDGRSRSGRAVQSGVYLYVARSSRQEFTGRVNLVR